MKKRRTLSAFGAMRGNTCDLLSSRSSIALILTLLLGACTTDALASQADEIGTISIQVRSQEGSALSSIEVLLLKDGKAIDTLTTGAEGEVSTHSIPGRITISIHHPGNAWIDETVEVKAGANTYEVVLVQALRADETVTVRADTTDITEQSSSPGASIEPAEAIESPSRPLTITDALPLVPGVVRAPNGQTQIEGAGEMHSALLINSLDVTDPVTGRFGLSVPIDVVTSLNVLTTPYLSQYGRFSAGVVTAETRGGGSKWHYDFNDPLPEFRIRSGHVRGLRSATPRLSFNGPLLLDRIFLSEGLEFVENKMPVRTLPFPLNETKTTSGNSFTQIDFTLTARQTLTVSFHATPQSYQNLDLGFFNPIEVTPDVEIRSYAGAITHRVALGGGLLQSTISSSELATAISPHGSLRMTVRPNGNGGNYFSEQSRSSRRFEWNEIWSLASITRPGNHKLQFGTSFARTTDVGEIRDKTVTMLDAQEVKFRTIDFAGGSPVNQGDLQPAIFLQDHWSLTPHLAFDAGVRFESQFITDTRRFAPRLGLVWSPGANGRTTLRGGVGNFFDSVPLNVYAFSHYPEQVITNYLPNGSVIGLPQRYLNVTSQTAESQFPLVGRAEKTGNFAPYTVAWNTELQHEFSDHLTMRAKYLESHGGGLVTISPRVLSGQNAYVLAGDGSSLYRQFEVTAQLSIQAMRRIYASYLRSFSAGTINEADIYLSDLSSPFVRGSLYSHRAGDLPNRFLAWGGFSLPSR